MTDVQQEKLRRFMADQLAASTVFEVIRDSFLKPSKDKDVNYLAASRLAIDFLAEAWKELEKYVPKDLSTSNQSENVGL